MRQGRENQGFESNDQIMIFGDLLSGTQVPSMFLPHVVLRCPAPRRAHARRLPAEIGALLDFLVATHQRGNFAGLQAWGEGIPPKTGHCNPLVGTAHCNP